MNVEEVLAPVLRDMRATGAPLPAVRFEKQAENDLWLAMLTAPDSSGHGCYVDLATPLDSAVAAAADGAQEWVFDQQDIPGTSNWPPCPLHPWNHPLGAKAVGGHAVWTCRKDGAVVTKIGRLAAPR